jgi:hypothetical protein
MTRGLVLLSAAILALASSADAQDWPSRIVVAVSGGVAPSGAGVSDRFDVRQFGDPETGVANVDYRLRTGPLVDGGVTVHVWRRLGAGVSVSHTSMRANATIEASIPHPFFLNTFRHVSGSTRVSRNETAAHLQAAYLLPGTGRLRVLLEGGPSIIGVSQPIVTEVQYSQVYPYDTATFIGALTGRGSATVVGFNAGGDATWMLGRSFGAGAIVRYTRGTATLDAGSGRRLRIHSGGPQIGAGIRLVFGH